MTLGKYISILRAQKDISQVELANMCDMGVSTISRIELDKALPRMNTLLKMENALGLKAGTLCNFDGRETLIESAEQID